MTTNQPPSVPVQPSQYNSVAQVSHSCTLLFDCSLSCISLQPLGEFDHLPGVDSTGTYPNVNYVDPPPPTRCPGAGGEYYDPPYLATVSVFTAFMSSLLTVAFPKGPAALRGNLEGHTPGITQCIPFTAGPPRLELYGPPIPVRVLPTYFSSRAHTAFLTAPLTVGCAQRLSTQSKTSSSQYSGAVSRKFHRQPCTS